MKKIISISLAIFMICAIFTGCKNPKIDKESSATPTSSNQETSNINQSIDIEKLTNDRYLQFENAVNANEYDKWFQKALAEDSLPIREIYAKYISFWTNELDFTLKEAQTLFEDQNEYLLWKYEIEQWLEITKASHNSEIKHFNAQMTRLEITYRYNKLIRQKVIDVKFFCYTLEKHMYDVPYKDSIGLKWLNDISI